MKGKMVTKNNKKKILTIGLTEKVTAIGNEGSKKVIIARIDTGAVCSSIDLNLATTLKLGPVIKTKLVKNANGINRRPVMMCKFKIKNIIVEADVTIADRRHLKYGILIGQNLLKKTNFLIDPKKG